MNANVNNESVRFASGMNISLAIWLILSPLILEYYSNWLALADAIVIGFAILGLAWFRMRRPMSTPIPTWTNLVLGAWLVISPFVLGFASVPTAARNDMGVGIAVIFFTSVGLMNGIAP